MLQGAASWSWPVVACRGASMPAHQSTPAYSTLVYTTLHQQAVTGCDRYTSIDMPTRKADDLSWIPETQICHVLRKYSVLGCLRSSDTDGYSYDSVIVVSTK